MNKGIDRALELFHDVEGQARKRQDSPIHPVSRLLVTLVFIVTTISFGKYQMTALFGMLVYIVLKTLINDIPVMSMLKRVKVILLMLLLIGIANPIFDRGVLTTMGRITITYGMVSMLTLFIKGIFTVCATYILVAETGISGICSSLRILKVPELLVTVVMLIYRYLIVLLQEVKNTSIAYSIRAPGQRGINIKAWGPFVGQILLRSMDRSQDIYDSMLLRGYNGNFDFDRKRYKARASTSKSLMYAVSWIAVIVSLRLFPILEWIGGLIT